MTKPLLTEHSAVTYSASVLLEERHIVALDKVLAYGGKSCAAHLSAVLSEREQKDVLPALTDLFERLRGEVPVLVRKGQDARAVFSGLAEAVRKTPDRPDQ